MDIPIVAVVVCMRKLGGENDVMNKVVELPIVGHGGAKRQLACDGEVVGVLFGQ